MAAGSNSTYQQPCYPFQTPPKLKVLKAAGKHVMTACMWLHHKTELQTALT